MAVTLPWFMAFDHLPSGAAWQATGEGAISAFLNATSVTFDGGTGRRYMALDQGSRGFYVQVAPQAELVVGLRLRCRGNGGNGPGELIQFQNSSGATLFSLYRENTWRLSLRRGSTTLATSDDPLLPASLFRYVELAVTLDAVTGGFTLRVDGSTVLGASGINTVAVAGTCERVAFVGVAGFTDVTDIYIRDVPVVGEPFYGPITMRWRPVKDDVLAQWTRNGGATNASRLIDPNGSDYNATYVESQTLGDIDEYTLEPLPPEVNSIICIVETQVSIAPSGGAPQTRRSLRTSAGTVAGPDQTVGINDYRTQMVHHMERPGGGGWGRAAYAELILRRESV